MANPLYTATALGTLVGISTKHVGRLAREGVLTKRKDGKYAEAAVREYCEYIKKSPSRSRLDEQLVEEKLRAARRQNDQAEACLAPVSVLGDALERVVAVWVPLLEGVPLALKRQLPSLTGDEIATVRAIVAQARNAIADAEINLDD
jgi:phage terminase Nu1 subunit (DNA packaging protein)